MKKLMKFLMLAFVINIFLNCSDDSVLSPEAPDTLYITDTLYFDTLSYQDSTLNKPVKYPVQNINYIDSLYKLHGDLIGYNIESVSFGNIIKHSLNKTEIVLKDDSFGLPDSWRYWWNTPLLDNDLSTNDTIIISNRGWETFYVPVYSYNQKDWYYFDEQNVKIVSGNELQIVHKFDKKEVWVARFFPYTLKNLNGYISTIINDELLKVDVVGYSKNDLPINRIKITNQQIKDDNKRVVLLHARTHPAETGQSFVLEGMINNLLKNHRDIFDSLVMVIVPIFNIDGVNYGHTRTDASYINLEMNWLVDEENPFYLTDKAEKETKVLHSIFTEYSHKQVKIALNLHCTNSEPNGVPFFYTHFGNDTTEYAPSEISLYNKMAKFASLMDDNYQYKIEEINSGGGFANSTYPESWWWKNYQDSVMAMTFETTYSKAGMDHWITIGDMEEMGKSLSKTIIDYLNE